MNYNYVIYGISNDFFRHSFADLQNNKNVALCEDPFNSRVKAINLLYKAHTYPYKNVCSRIPCKSMWNRFCHVPQFIERKTLCFIFTGKYFSHDYYIRYLREKYDNCRVVLSFRDLIRNNKMWFPSLDMEHIKTKFDLVMSYDKGDCEKYGLQYFNTEASKMSIGSSEDYPKSDVVFIGAEKNRYDRIVKAYDILTDAGLSCYFYVVTKNKRLKYKGIIFSDKLMPYDDMVRHTVDSRCILELSQKDEYGFTSRSQEAIMYNKKLITDSRIIREQRFFPSENILLIKDVDDIDPSFVKKESNVDYGYRNEYSPVRMLEGVEKYLETLDERSVK